MKPRMRFQNEISFLISFLILKSHTSFRNLMKSHKPKGAKISGRFGRNQGANGKITGAENEISQKRNRAFSKTQAETQASKTQNAT